MDAFIARQPIFNSKRQVSGYELLYRDGQSAGTASFSDGDKATCRLLSDAITQFGLPKLTNHKLAYVNFTENLILNDFVLLANPQEVVVELLEDIQISNDLLEKLRVLKEQGYVLALDDYCGDSSFDPVLPYIDILKVDFRLTAPARRWEITQWAKRQQGLRLLAEKVETQQEFESAVEMGYQLFQGFFFQRPVTLKKKIPSLAASSYVQILNEVQRKEVDFSTCAHIVHADAVLTYSMLQKVQTLEYYRGNAITAIQQALIVMGTNELRRWILLMLARENNVTQCDELVRQSYLRGIFAERLLEHTAEGAHSENGFLLGIFSLLDQIMGMSMEEVLQDVELPEEVAKTLLCREESLYSSLLLYVTVYEMGNPKLLLPDLGLDLSPIDVSHIYMNCLLETDKAFGEIGVDRAPCRTTKYWRRR